MKTIKELYGEGKLSTRTYNLIRRKTGESDITIDDLFSRYGEDKIMGWSQAGPKTVNELKGLL